jgi:hypothetical protein
MFVKKLFTKLWESHINLLEDYVQQTNFFSNLFTLNLLVYALNSNVSMKFLISSAIFAVILFGFCELEILFYCKFCSVRVFLIFTAVIIIIVSIMITPWLLLLALLFPITPIIEGISDVMFYSRNSTKFSLYFMSRIISIILFSVAVISTNIYWHVCLLLLLMNIIVLPIITANLFEDLL